MSLPRWSDHVLCSTLGSDLHCQKILSWTEARINTPQSNQGFICPKKGEWCWEGNALSVHPSQVCTHIQAQVCYNEGNPGSWWCKSVIRSFLSSDQHLWRNPCSAALATPVSGDPFCVLGPNPPSLLITFAETFTEGWSWLLLHLTYIRANSFSMAYLITIEELRKVSCQVRHKGNWIGQTLPFRPDWSPASEKSMPPFIFFLMSHAPRWREQDTVSCWYDETVAWRYYISQKGQEGNF